MAYVPVPKDLTKIKTKVMFNLTKRQLICFGLGALVGVPVFFLLKPRISISAAALVMIVIMLPFFLFAILMKLSELHEPHRFIMLFVFEKTTRDFDRWRFVLEPGCRISDETGEYECTAIDHYPHPKHPMVQARLLNPRS